MRRATTSHCRPRRQPRAARAVIRCGRSATDSAFAQPRARDHAVESTRDCSIAAMLGVDARPERSNAVAVSMNASRRDRRRQRPAPSQRHRTPVRPDSDTCVRRRRHRRRRARVSVDPAPSDAPERSGRSCSASVRLAEVGRVDADGDDGYLCGRHVDELHRLNLDAAILPSRRTLAT